MAVSRCFRADGVDEPREVRVVGRYVAEDLRDLFYGDDSIRHVR
jgi:hypothetical protein